MNGEDNLLLVDIRVILLLMTSIQKEIKLNIQVKIQLKKTKSCRSKL